MEGKLKTPYWDFTEFQRGTIQSMDAVDGSSSIVAQRTKGEFLVDLKLGQVGNSNEEPGCKLKELTVSKSVVSPPPISLKRARAANNGGLKVSCLVDGCNSDLRKCREYHRRHKVCELHSKTPEVSIGGHKQRFCQQCSRFHSLEEFDEVKRSCRKRLDGHNRRRRKPQPDPPLHTRSFLPRYQGTQCSYFSSPTVYPSTAAGISGRSRLVKPKEDDRIFDRHQQLQLLEKQNSFVGSSFNSYKGEKQFPFLQCNSPFLGSQTSSAAGVWQPHHRDFASPGSGVCSHKPACDGLISQVSDSDRALSLLSLPKTQTPGIGFSHQGSPSSAPLIQPLLPSLQYDNSLELVSSEVMSNASETDFHCQGMFHLGSDESSGNNAPKTLPFYWEY